MIPASPWQHLITGFISFPSDDLGLLEISGVLLCSLLGRPQICVVCPLHPYVVNREWLSAPYTGLVRTAVHGPPSNMGATVPVSSAWPHPWSLGTELWSYSWGGMAPLLYNMSSHRFITLPIVLSAVRSSLPYLRQIYLTFLLLQERALPYTICIEEEPYRMTGVIPVWAERSSLSPHKTFCL